MDGTVESSIEGQRGTGDTPLQKYLRLKQLAIPSRITVLLVSMLLVSPAVIFWSWLVIVPARVAIICREECQCNIDASTVFCNGSSITAVLSIRFTAVRMLVISENNITVIEKDSFVSLTELKSLHLEDLYGLRKIERGAFNGLTQLAELSIEGGNLVEIHPGTFQNLSDLQNLLLPSNGIEHVSSEMFGGLDNLKRINLANNNIQDLQADTFLGLPNIQSLSLQNNPRLEIPTDSPFIISHTLSQLNISYCNVSLLTFETFSNVSELKSLDLKGNNLRNIEIDIFTALPKLSTLYLYDNPLHCDSQLKKVWRLCEDRNITTVFRGEVPKCDTPWEVTGMWWGVLEKGECLQNDTQYCGDYRNTSYSYNYTKNYEENRVQGKVLLYIFSFIFGTTSNVIILIIIICNKDMRTVPNMYIINLVISDIIYLTLLFSAAFENRKPYKSLDGDFRCAFIPFLRRLSVGLSAYSVAVLSIQRYRVTVNPFSSPPTWRVTVTTVCVVWIVAALFAIPSTISQNLCKGLDSIITYYKFVVIFELLVSCVIPLCIIAFTYIMTARHLVENSHPISEETQNHQRQTRRNNAKIVVGLIIVFLVSYLPYHVLWTYVVYNYYYGIEIINGNISIEKLLFLYLISTCFLLINSCLNPVALFCTSSPFRKHLKRYLTCFCKTNSPPTDLKLARRN